MRRFTALSLWLAALGLAIPAHAHAQRATVYYDHQPGTATSDGRLSYIESGDKAGERRLGEPPRLLIPKGAKACIVIEHANPLLYAYSLSAKPLSSEVPADLATIIAALGQVLSTAKGAGIAPADTVANLYFGKVALLVEALQDMSKQKLASDTVSLDSTRTRVAALAVKAESINQDAKTILAALSTADRADPAVILATQQQESLWERITNLRKEVQTAWEKSHDPVCVTINDKALGITLSVKPKLDTTSGFKAQRPTGNVAAFEATPSTSSLFEVGFGAMLSVLVDGQKQFGVTNGLVTAGPDRSPKFSPTLFASARATRSSFLWGTIGASASDKGLTSLFLGFSSRFGVAIVGPEMSIGVGLAITRVPTGLSTGAVGAPLPQGIDKIDAIVKTDLRAGLGIMFTLTGISPKGKEKEKAKDEGNTPQ